MINIQPRTGENTVKIPLRTDRFFAVNSSWYFSTREGANIGPFESKTEAQAGLTEFIEFISIAPVSTKEKFFSSFPGI